jgi:uncharacterized protein (TIGR00251 family)
MIDFTEKDGALIFSVRVVPRSSKSEIAGSLGGALKVKIASPPVDGAANAELVKLLSKTFGAAKSDIEIVSGQTSKNKQVKIYNLSADDFLKAVS